jgi:hypothetical protein
VQAESNDPDTQNFFAQTQPETSKMSTQKESLVENISASMQNMLAPDGFEEGQEHIDVQSEMGQTAQDDINSSEVETNATNMWQDLQQATEQDCLMEGQEQTETMSFPNGKAEYQIRQIERTMETISIPHK